ncbi:MAG: hypothetical protein HZA50_11150 [Planctomycetes bacterium]|nr:hypothetical protein [Planctomycetota bacterium]
MLEIDARIPHGNIADPHIQTEGGKVHVAFSAHSHGGPECLWFCFRLKNKARHTRPIPVVLHLRNIGNMLGLSPGNARHVRPVCRIGGGLWQRLDPPRPLVHPDGRCDILWQMNLAGRSADVAFCYPYGSTELGSLLGDICGRWSADTIGVSQAGRPIVRLSNAKAAKGGRRPGLYLIARQHSGETPGSWVLDGMIRRFDEMGPAAPIVWAVPFSNVDGVEQGDYGKDNFPYDLNRAWGILPMRHEVRVIQPDLHRWKERCIPALAVDLHAPGGAEKDGAYCFLPNKSKHPFQHRIAKVWADAVEKSLGPDYAGKPFGRIADYPSRWETPHFDQFCHRIGVPALSLETSYQACRAGMLDIDGYRQIGRRIADGIAAKLKIRAGKGLSRQGGAE